MTEARQSVVTLRYKSFLINHADMKPQISEVRKNTIF
jgi:hypothetical protein